MLWLKTKKNNLAMSWWKGKMSLRASARNLWREQYCKDLVWP